MHKLKKCNLQITSHNKVVYSASPRPSFDRREQRVGLGSLMDKEPKSVEWVPFLSRLMERSSSRMLFAL